LVSQTKRNFPGSSVLGLRSLTGHSLKMGLVALLKAEKLRKGDVRLLIGPRALEILQ